MTISKHLELNMARLLDVLLDNNMLIVKALTSLTLCRIKLVKKLLLVFNDSHAFASSSKRSFNDNREAYFLRFSEQEVRILVVTMVAGYDRNLCVAHDELRLTF
jgi:transcription initiation factor IIE alpha subunit